MTVSIFETVVDTEDIVVLGPPAFIEVGVDIGSTGERGAKFFIGSGNPNTPGVITNSADVIIGDLFINSSTSSDYGWVYAYVSRPGGNTWEQVVRLQPSIYSQNVQSVFNSSGICNLSLNLADITPDLAVTDAARFIVQVTPISENPIALSINSKSISFNSSSTNLLANISTASGNGTNIIYTTQSNHGFTAGQKVTVTGITPLSLNVTNALIVSTPASNQFAVQSSIVDAYTSGGTARVTQNPSSFNMVLEGVSYVSGSWSALQGSVLLGITITVV